MYTYIMHINMKHAVERHMYECVDVYLCHTYTHTNIIGRKVYIQTYWQWCGYVLHVHIGLWNIYTCSRKLYMQTYWVERYIYKHTDNDVGMYCMYI